jgi:pyrimidine-nucleoside phosphorylase
MSNISPFEFIAQKQAGQAHTPEDIKRFIDDFMCDEIPDYQMSAWLMAVFFKGMTNEETVALTNAMIETGERIEFGNIYASAGDKHSTGGVGDKITLLLAPLVAAAGVAVPTITGRGLGFTGGTLDKLESIPGMRTDLSVQQIVDQIKSFKLAFGAQTSDLVPADKSIYALRDVTSTVRSYPLITASILSKKVTEGIDGIVFDVKCGKGAFMESYDEALKLSNWLVRVASCFKMKVACLITDMNAPLGTSVGNWLEIVESVRALKSEAIEPDIKELTLALGGTLLAVLGECDTPDSGWRKLDTIWSSGAGFKKFVEAVKAQGGDINSFSNMDDINKPKASLTLKADKPGYIFDINSREIGFSSIALGAGRKNVNSVIDSSAGILFHKSVGSKVVLGTPILTLFAESEELCEGIVDRVRKAVRIEDIEPKKKPLIIRAITTEGDYSWDEFRKKKTINIMQKYLHLGQYPVF